MLLLSLEARAICLDVGSQSLSAHALNDDGDGTSFRNEALVGGIHVRQLAKGATSIHWDLGARIGVDV